MLQICLVLCGCWFNAEPIRVINDNSILGDIESHLNAGHPYGDSDKVGFVHEGTHGINSLLRNQHNSPCFYLLQNRAAKITEPNTTLERVAATIPVSLRGQVYQLYLVQMQGYWNQQPSYILDEYVAYTNGAEARLKLGIKDRTETIDYMLELSIYATCLARECPSPELKEFLNWQMERVSRIYQQSNYKSPYVQQVTEATDDEAMRFKGFAAIYYTKVSADNAARSGSVLQSLPVQTTLLYRARIQRSQIYAEGVPGTIRAWCETTLLPSYGNAAGIYANQTWPLDYRPAMARLRSLRPVAPWDGHTVPRGIAHGRHPHATCKAANTTYHQRECQRRKTGHVHRTLRLTA